ncbi:hypothetical protein MMC13_003533 [Lambiella insularis]|nr:hypothetical protein [Lambiella insularis]
MPSVNEWITAISSGILAVMAVLTGVYGFFKAQSKPPVASTIDTEDAHHSLVKVIRDQHRMNSDLLSGLIEARRVKQEFIDKFEQLSSEVEALAKDLR